MPTLTQKAPVQGPALWTDEEFLDWLQPGRFADLIHGQRFMHSPVNLRHADLVDFLDPLLRLYIEMAEVGGKLHRESVAVRLSRRNVFMPDLSWFAPKQLKQLKPTHAPVAPVWVCGALSPATAKRDLGIKFAAYEDYGVLRYWILDPQQLKHRFFRRAGDTLVEFAQDSDWVESATIKGFKVRRDWLNPGKLPKVSACLKQLLPKGSL